MTKCHTCCVFFPHIYNDFITCPLLLFTEFVPLKFRITNVSNSSWLPETSLGKERTFMACNTHEFWNGVWRLIGLILTPRLITSESWLTVARWWFQTFFIFTPTWGNDPIWLYNIFQMGWNHQLGSHGLNLNDSKRIFVWRCLKHFWDFEIKRSYPYHPWDWYIYLYMNGWFLW